MLDNEQLNNQEQQIQPVSDELSQSEVMEPTRDELSQPETKEAKPVEQVIETKPSDTERAQAKNFRQLREQKEKAERERDELLQMLQQKQAAPEEEDIQLKPDDLVEGKHFNKEIKKLRAKLQVQEQQNNIMAIESQLKSQYPDFDKVVSKENIERLRDEYPEIAATIASSNDLKSKGVSAYTMIKKLVAPQEDLYEVDRDRAQKNASKPKPLAAVSPQQGDSALSRANAFANGLTDELRKQLLKEMNDSRRGY